MRCRRGSSLTLPPYFPTDLLALPSALSPTLQTFLFLRPVPLAHSPFARARATHRTLWFTTSDAHLVNRNVRAICDSVRIPPRICVFFLAHHRSKFIAWSLCFSRMQKRRRNRRRNATKGKRVCRRRSWKLNELPGSVLWRSGYEFRRWRVFLPKRDVVLTRETKNVECARRSHMI